MRIRNDRILSVLAKSPLTRDFSDKSRRINIAEDVIAQIRAGHYLPESGNFVKVETEDAREEIELYSRPFHENIVGGHTCRVCALGGLFTSSVRLYNAFRSTEYGRNVLERELFTQLQKFFSEKQLQLIELSFEGGNGWFRNDSYGPQPSLLTQDEIASAVEFYASFRNHEDRALAVMHNIIENDGTFIPAYTVGPTYAV